MRIKEKTPTATCLKMTDEMNGDTRRELTANKETEHKLNCNIPLSSEDNEFNCGSKLSCNKGNQLNATNSCIKCILSEFCYCIKT